MWGDGSHGKLGFDHLESFKIPTFLPTFKPKSVAVGDQNTLAIDQNGRVLCWGRSDLHGHKDPEDRKKPKYLKVLKSKFCVKVSCGSAHSVCLNSDGTVFAWVKVLISFSILGLE